MAIPITAANAHYTHTNQDGDERQAVLTDVQRCPWDYFGHPDAEVRARSRDVWLAWRLGARTTALPMVTAPVVLRRLYQRLRVLAVLETAPGA